MILTSDMTCTCGLGDGIHWYVDYTHASYMYMLGRSPEEAEHSLRSWAAKILKQGHLDLEVRPMAARILSCHELYMVQICTPKLRLPTDIIL